MIFVKECLAVRRKTSLPFVLDEIVDDMHSLLSLVKRKYDLYNLPCIQAVGFNQRLLNYKDTKPLMSAFL